MSGYGLGNWAASLGQVRRERRGDALIREQYRVLCRQVPTMYLMLLINCLFLAAFASISVSAGIAFGMPLGIFIAIVVRMIAWMRRKSLPDAEPVTRVRKKLRVAECFAAILAIALTGWTIMLFHVLPPGDRLLVPLFTALSTITCGYCLLSLPVAAYAVLILGAVPISLALLVSGDLSAQASGLNILTVAGLILRMVTTQYGQLSRLVASRSEVMDEKMKVNRLAYRDDLTDLPNRRAFLAALDAAHHGRVGRDPVPGIAVIMIDLDGFKPINDTYGHHTGDALLIGTARRLAATLDGADIVARLGGDEFAILLHDLADPAAAQRGADRVQRLFERPFDIGGQDFRVGASLGLAFAGLPLTHAADVLNHADIALFAAKKSKADRPVLFAPRMEESVRRRMAIEQALGDPALCDRITLSFQPIFESAGLKNGTFRIAGFEALARWDLPVLGRVPPSEFVTIAEQRGMTNSLTSRLFGQALAVARAWPDGVLLSFNLSAAELASPRLATLLIDLMTDAGFDPARLAVEVTETALLNDFEAARLTLDALRRAGAQVWLDDFGAGYASIGYLRELAVDSIKLDGGLIQTVLVDAAARNLLVGVLHLCQAIGAPVIAEMVETADQLALLRTLPIAMLQGYYFARPMTGDATIALIEAGLQPETELLEAVS